MADKMADCFGCKHSSPYGCSKIGNTNIVGDCPSYVPRNSGGSTSTGGTLTSIIVRIGAGMIVGALVEGAIYALQGKGFVFNTMGYGSGVGLTIGLFWGVFIKMIKAFKNDPNNTKEGWLRAGRVVLVGLLWAVLLGVAGYLAGKFFFPDYVLPDAKTFLGIPLYKGYVAATVLGGFFGFFIGGRVEIYRLKKKIEKQQNRH